MTIINIHMKEEDKKKLQACVESLNVKSMSEFMRKLISERIKIEEFTNTNKDPSSLEIPEYIPKEKYVGFVNGALIAVADSPSEVSQIAVEKFPNLPLIIKFNGPKIKPIEYCYASLIELQCWKYIQLEDNSYPVIPIIIQTDSSEKQLFASVDTAASLCVLKDDIFTSKDLRSSREEQISTAAGIITTKIYKAKVKITDVEFDIEFIIAPIANGLPFKMLIGRNLLDQLDAYFLGKKQILCIKIAE